MMTVAQWISLRRVDHASLPAFNFDKGFHIAHPRFRKHGAGAHPNLKVFDQYLTAFAAANNDQDKVGILGSIIYQCDLFIAAGGHAARYDGPAQQLYNTAVADMTHMCGAGQAQRTADIVAAGAGNAIAGRTVTINVYCLIAVGAGHPAGVNATINAHILAANNSQAYQDASLTIVRANPNPTYVSQHAGQSILLTNPPAPANMVGKLQDSGPGGVRLIDYCNAQAGAGAVDIVYVPGYDQDDVQGRTFRAGNDYGSIPVRPIVTVTLNPPLPVAPTYPTTLGHEIGHGLTGDPNHSNDPANLMSSGAIRNGVDNMNLGQIAWFRRNPYTV